MEDLIILSLTNALLKVKNVKDVEKRIIFESDVRQNVKIVVAVMIKILRAVQLRIENVKTVGKLDILLHSANLLF